MKHNEILIAEVKNEAASTRKVLERVPLDKSTWKPHEKSMALGRLATHVAELPNWINVTLDTTELDFSKREYKPTVVNTTEELLALHEKNVAGAIAALEKATDEDFAAMWSLRHGEQVFFTLPKTAVLRSFSMSHLYHHRGQLTVYLRLLDIPLPSVYGPTADEN